MSGLKDTADRALRALGYKRLGRRLVRLPKGGGAAGATERNLELCADHGIWDAYYREAEQHIRSQWDHYIGPRIRDADFSAVLELAPGVGRNTALLLPLVEAARDGAGGEIHLVEYNGTALEECRRRFAGYAGPARLSYYRNDGTTLASADDGRRVPDAAISFVYSWDSMVHFDREVIRAYVAEFARVLRPGGTGFVHHSNYAALPEAGRSAATATAAAAADFHENPQWRSDMSGALFRRFCEDAGLECCEQALIPWGGVEDIDCISLFRKRAE